MLNSETDFTSAERSFLNLLAKFDNIPRKKAKFLNFVKNITGNRTNAAIIDSVWDKMQTAYEVNMKKSTKQENGKCNLLFFSCLHWLLLKYFILGV